MTKTEWAASFLFILASGSAASQTESSPEDGSALTVNPAYQPDIDRAVAAGLDYLARTQCSQGCWTGDVGHKRMDGYVVFNTSEDQLQRGAGHPGVTAIAGLAFLADGHMAEHGCYGPLLSGAIDYLTRHTNDVGYVSDSETRMYSHAFATLFLSQVYGMTAGRADEVHKALSRAVEFLDKTQNRHGAWRYSPFTFEADLSVTVCQVQALRAARNVGIHVPPDTIDRVVEYLQDSRIPDGQFEGAFFYKIHGRGARSKTSFTVNAAAVTSLHSAGVYREDEYGAAVRFLDEQYHTLSARYPDHYFFWYGNYYAAQALHMDGGRRWQRYWNWLRDDLLRRQHEDGHWDNSVGPGPAFSTAMACLLLRVPAQLLPIFQR